MRSFRAKVQEIFDEQPDRNWLTIIGRSEEKRFTIRELYSRISDYCQFYEQHGVKENDTVLIILKESLDLFASFFAGIIYGALPAYFSYPSPKQTTQIFLNSVDDLVQYNEVKLVVTYAGLLEILQEQSSISSFNFIGYFDYMKIIPQLNSSVDRIEPKQEGFLQFSSGTTGAKKGVKISIGALLNQIYAYNPFVRYDESSKVVSWLPHYHDMGLIACMLMPFIEKVPIVMMSPFEWVKTPRMLFDAITKYRATHLWLPNFALGHLTNRIREDELSEFDLSSIKQLVCCSEPVLYDTVTNFSEKFQVCGLKEEVINNCYAMAENTFAMTSSQRGPIFFLEIDGKTFLKDGAVKLKEGGKKISSVGVGLPNIEIKIVAPEGLKLDDNQVGEVLIKSNCMLSSYHNNPIATQKAITNEGWFKTGDFGFFHRGELFITGRKKDLIIIGGKNIYPQDIESILDAENHLKPGRNVVFGVLDDRIGTEKIVILAELNKSHINPESIDIIRLRTKIFNLLDVSVSEILILPPNSLLKSTAGKISRQLNKKAYLEGLFQKITSKKEDGKIEKIVVSVIPSSIKPRINEDTPLMSSGLIDSFAFAELVSRIEREYNLKIPEPYWKASYFESVSAIRDTIQSCQSTSSQSLAINESWLIKREQSLANLKSQKTAKMANQQGWIEYLINNTPIPLSSLYPLLLRFAGVKVGKNVRFIGRIHLKIRGKGENIIIGDNVRLGNNVDLRNRESGRIVLKERAYIDDNVRLVAAREGAVEIGFGTEIGCNTIINSGGMTTIGEFCMIASGVNINSSSHLTDINSYIRAQGYQYGVIEIGNDVWIGADAAILMNSKLGEGAVIASNSVVSGEIPPFAICAGVPAKVIKYR